MAVSIFFCYYKKFRRFASLVQAGLPSHASDSTILLFINISHGDRVLSLS